MATTPAKKTSIPANVKKPQDHAPAKEDVTGPKDVTVEWNGHEYTIPGESFDDLEFMDIMMTIDSVTDENQQGVMAYKAAKFLLGPDLFAKYLDNERGENGRVKASGFMPFFQHVMEASKRGN